MNIRTLRAGGLCAYSFALAGLSAAVLVSGCAHIVDPLSNSSACERAMRDALAAKTDNKLTIVHTGAGIGGARVVVEATIEGAVGASAAVTASGASAASAATVAGAPAAASSANATTTPATPAATAAAFAAPAGGYSSSGLTANAASQMNAALSGESNGPLSRLKSKKKPGTAAAAECLFEGKTLSSFRWLAPAAYVAADTPASDAAAQ